MGWIEPEPEPCKHPGQPEARYGEKRQWECDTCGQRFRVKSVDYGHDVMPGESPVDAHWIKLWSPLNGGSTPQPETETATSAPERSS